MSYGLKLYNTSGQNKIITPDDATVIAAGSTTMSNSLEGDNTYGEDIALGATYNESDLSVLVVPRRPSYNVTYNRYIDGGTLYYNTFYLDSTKTYYTRNTSTGVMTSFSAGNKTVNVKNTWNPVLSVFPIAFWDKKGATTFSNIRLFAATAYLFRDTVNDTNFSLSGTASGSGKRFGEYSYVKDNDVGTFVGDMCYVLPGNSCSIGYTAEVDLGSAKTITKVELAHRPYAWVIGGNYAHGSYSVKLYYGSAWHTIWGQDWSANYAPTPAPDPIYTYQIGHWEGVTKIQVTASGSAQAGTYGTEAIVEHVTHELRAWGSSSTNDEENSIVYSIGDNGISIIDYMIMRKKYS